MSANDPYDTEWSRPENWRGGLFGIYYAPGDPRVWVPKRIPIMGWTLNFARRRAWYWLAGLVALILFSVIGGLMSERHAAR